MKSIAGELYDVYLKMGGTGRPRQTIAGMVDAITGLIGEGGGGGIFWVTLTATEDEETGDYIYSVDKTVAEIVSAVGEDKLPIVNAAELGESNGYLIPNFISEQGAYFSAASWLPAEFEGGADSVSYAKVDIGADGSVAYSASQYDFPTA